MNKKTIICFGADGYIGFNLITYLGKKYPAWKIIAVDNYIKRQHLKEVNANSLISVEIDLIDRLEKYNEKYHSNIHVVDGDVTKFHLVKKLIETYKPDALVNLAQMPSAPYSMINCNHAVWTYENNTINNLIALWMLHEHSPDTHYIKLSTMGIYGLPNFEIPEGYFNIEYKGRKDFVPAPHMPGSFYHLTKSFETLSDGFCCKTWGLKITDIAQGVVYGVMDEDSELQSMFYYDDIFGTALNRFLVQAIIGHPITVYGEGLQKRGFLHIKEAVHCIEKYILNPLNDGEHKVVNQLTDQRFNIMELAEMVKKHGDKLGLNVTIENIPNPRTEKPKHYYKVDTTTVDSLGIDKVKLEEEIPKLLKFLMKYKNNVNKDVIKPSIQWNDKA